MQPFQLSSSQPVVNPKFSATTTNNNNNNNNTTTNGATTSSASTAVTPAFRTPSEPSLLFPRSNSQDNVTRAPSAANSTNNKSASPTGNYSGNVAGAASAAAAPSYCYSNSIAIAESSLVEFQQLQQAVGGGSSVSSPAGAPTDNFILPQQQRPPDASHEGVDEEEYEEEDERDYRTDDDNESLDNENYALIPAAQVLSRFKPPLSFTEQTKSFFVNFFHNAVGFVFKFVKWAPPNYQFKNWLVQDIVGGIVMSVMLLPMGLAYARLMGIAPILGVLSSAWYSFAYAVVGSTAKLSMGPAAETTLMLMDAPFLPPSRLNENDMVVKALITTTTTMMPNGTLMSITTTTASAVSPTSGLDPRVNWYVLITLEVGIFTLIYTVFRGGAVIRNSLSRTVAKAYASAAGVLLVLTQIKSIFNLSGASTIVVWDTLVVAASSCVEQCGLNSLLSAFWFGVFMLYLQYAGVAFRKMTGGSDCPSWVPHQLIIVVFAILTTYALDLHGNEGLAILGDIQPSPIKIGLPEFTIADVIKLMPYSALFAVVSFLQMYGIASNLNPEVDANQELFSQGACATCCSLLGGFAGCSSFARCSVLDILGVHTPLSSLVAGLLLMFYIEVLASLGVFYYMPSVVLTAIIVSAVSKLINFSDLPMLWSVSKPDFVVWVITFLGVTNFGVTLGISCGIGLSILIVLWRVSAPEGDVVAYDARSGTYRSTHGDNELLVSPNLLIYEYGHPLYFINVNSLRQQLEETVEREHRPIQHLVLDMTHSPGADASAAETFNTQMKSFKAKLGIELIVVLPSMSEVRELFSALPSLNFLVYESVLAAVAYCNARTESVLPPALRRVPRIVFEVEPADPTKLTNTLIAPAQTSPADKRVLCGTIALISHGYRTPKQKLQAEFNSREMSDMLFGYPAKADVNEFIIKEFDDLRLEKVQDALEMGDRHRHQTANARLAQQQQQQAQGNNNMSSPSAAAAVSAMPGFASATPTPTQPQQKKTRSDDTQRRLLRHKVASLAYSAFSTQGTFEVRVRGSDYDAQAQQFDRVQVQVKWGGNLTELGYEHSSALGSALPHRLDLPQAINDWSVLRHQWEKNDDKRRREQETMMKEQQKQRELMAAAAAASQHDDDEGEHSQNQTQNHPAHSSSTSTTPNELSVQPQQPGTPVVVTSSGASLDCPPAACGAPLTPGGRRSHHQHHFSNHHHPNHPRHVRTTSGTGSGGSDGGAAPAAPLSARDRRKFTLSPKIHARTASAPTLRRKEQLPPAMFPSEPPASAAAVAAGAAPHRSPRMHNNNFYAARGLRPGGGSGGLKMALHHHVPSGNKRADLKEWIGSFKNAFVKVSCVSAREERVFDTCNAVTWAVLDKLRCQPLGTSQQQQQLAGGGSGDVCCAVPGTVPIAAAAAGGALAVSVPIPAAGGGVPHMMMNSAAISAAPLARTTAGPSPNRGHHAALYGGGRPPSSAGATTSSITLDSPLAASVPFRIEFNDELLIDIPKRSISIMDQQMLGVERILHREGDLDLIRHYTGLYSILHNHGTPYNAVRIAVSAAQTFVRDIDDAVRDLTRNTRVVLTNHETLHMLQMRYKILLMQLLPRADELPESLAAVALQQQQQQQEQEYSDLERNGPDRSFYANAYASSTFLFSAGSPSGPLPRQQQQQQTRPQAPPEFHYSKQNRFFKADRLRDLYDNIAYDAAHNFESLNDFTGVNLRHLAGLLGRLYRVLAAGQFGLTDSEKRMSSALCIVPLWRRVREDVHKVVLSFGTDPQSLIFPLQLMFCASTQVAAFRNTMAYTKGTGPRTTDAAALNRGGEMELSEMAERGWHFMAHFVFRIFRIYPCDSDHHHAAVGSGSGAGNSVESNNSALISPPFVPLVSKPSTPTSASGAKVGSDAAGVRVSPPLASVGAVMAAPAAAAAKGIASPHSGAAAAPNASAMLPESSISGFDFMSQLQQQAPSGPQFEVEVYASSGVPLAGSWLAKTNAVTMRDSAVVAPLVRVAVFSNKDFDDFIDEVGRQAELCLESQLGRK